MNMNRSLQFLLTSLTLTMSCTSTTKDEALLKEAANIHNEAAGLAVQLEKQMDLLLADTTLVKDSVLAWRAALAIWKSEVVEVPGNDHEEGDHSGHGHSHTKAPDVTPEQMLTIQKELKEQIQKIQLRINPN